VTDRPTLAAVAPLFLGLATREQGRAVAARLARDFLRPGGLVTTLANSGQQWDAPNGWAPLEWMAIEGVRQYGRADLADTVRDRWLDLNRRTFRATGRMMEKYDVVDLARLAGGGEYPGRTGLVDQRRRVGAHRRSESRSALRPLTGSPFTCHVSPITRSSSTHHPSPITPYEPLGPPSP